MIDCSNAKFANANEREIMVRQIVADGRLSLENRKRLRSGLEEPQYKVLLNFYLSQNHASLERLSSMIHVLIPPIGTAPD